MANNDYKKITVVMAVYNGEKFLPEAIESVLTQSFSDFELLIVDDGSTDRSLEIIGIYQKKDKRIRVIKNEKNIGIVNTRNLCFEQSNSEYIAILDHDDIAVPTRLQEQMDFMDTHRDFGLLGSWVEHIDENNKPNGVMWKNREPAEEIPCLMLFVNYFTQSAVMIRKKALPMPPYRADFILAEDYDLWVRIAQNWKVWNLQKVLTKYRIHTTNITKIKGEQSRNASSQVKKYQLLKLGIDPSDEELLIHRTSFVYEGKNIEEFIDKRLAWFDKITEANRINKIYKQEVLSHVISKLFLLGCRANARCGFWIWKKFWQTGISKNLKVSDSMEVLKFFIKCLIKK